MAPVKRRPATRSRNKMRRQRRKPNIEELVYKFLRGAQDQAWHNHYGTCRLCDRHKLVADAFNARRTMKKRMTNKRVKRNGRTTKPRVEKLRRTASDHVSSAIHKAHGADELKGMKNYIQKALDFAVKSGYLYKEDKSPRVFRVSSELMNDSVRTNKPPSDERAVSQERERTPRRTPSKLENFREMDAARRRKQRKRRSSRRRSRSGSKRRRRSRRSGRRRSRSQHAEEPTENADDMELEHSEDGRRGRSQDTDRHKEKTRLNSVEDGRTATKSNEDESESSSDEEDTEYEEKKRDEPSKS